MKQLNTITFKTMLQNGANNLTNDHERINALNVFPVPDGDTGTNMSLTFNNGSKAAITNNGKSLDEISKALSKGLLMGARGNSGVILSQIFRGFSQGLEGVSEASVAQVAKAFVRGSEVAYRAVMKPVEGTILTVVRESTFYANKFIEDNPDVSLKEYFDVLVKEAEKSLEFTPELLPVLKEVGVVDSGGAGLLAIIEGFRDTLYDKSIDLNEAGTSDQSAAATMSSDEFGYCTEFITRLDDKGLMNFTEDKMKTALANEGNSIVVVQDEDLVKVHVHTLSPGNVLNMAQQYGEFVTLKIENMQEQHDHIISQEPTKTEVASKYALVAVAAGEGLSDYFKSIRVDAVISGGQTMNPSTEDFVAVIEKLNAENIIILPNNSNIVLAANQAKDIIENKNIEVVVTKSAVEGIAACINFNPDVDLADNLANMAEGVSNTTTGEVTNAIKDTQFEGVEIKAGDFMGITSGKIVVSDKKIDKTIKTLLSEMITEESELVTLVVGAEATKKLVDETIKYVEDDFNLEVEIVEGGQPVYQFIIGVE